MATDILVQLISPDEERHQRPLAPEEQRLTVPEPATHREATPAQASATLFPWQAPYFILAISIVEVAVFIWGGPRLQMSLVYDPHHREELWRFLTYMLLHSGQLHLALNIVIQCLLATPLEHEQGHLRTGIVYLGGGIGGSLGTSMLEPDLYVVGASAGVYALLISQLAHILLNFRAIRYKMYRLVAVLVLALTDIAFSLHHHFSFGNVCPRVGWAAHCSGAIAGLLLGLVFFKGASKPADGPWVRVVTWTAAAMLAAGITAAVVCNVFLPQSPMHSE
ncbi:protein rhomboid [Anabrus simplex]|uniref:protein rhomboid n=1 Tax=Anabrus simplex TaxID=316456 RepID=UPI0035A2B4F5